MSLGQERVSVGQQLDTTLGTLFPRPRPRLLSTPSVPGPEDVYSLI